MDAFEALLADCGVREDSLTAAEREALDQAGFAVLPQVASPARPALLRAAFERACAGVAGPVDAGVVTALWMPDDFTADDGATRALPGAPLGG